MNSGIELFFASVAFLTGGSIAGYIKGRENKKYFHPLVRSVLYLAMVIVFAAGVFLIYIHYNRVVWLGIK